MFAVRRMGELEKGWWFEFVTCKPIAGATVIGFATWAKRGISPSAVAVAVDTAAFFATEREPSPAPSFFRNPTRNCDICAHIRLRTTFHRKVLRSIITDCPQKRKIS